MQNIKISIFLSLIMTTACCLANSDDKKTKRTFVQKILDSKDDQKIKPQKDVGLNDVKAEQRFITRKKIEIFMTVALILFIAASIKFEFFPSAEQKRLRALHGPKIGITGMSKSFEGLGITLLIDWFRKFK